MKLFFVILLLTVFYQLKSQDLLHLESLIGKEAKDFTDTTLDAKSFQLSSLKGKYIILHFWDRRCGGCNKELPDLNRLVAEMDTAEFRLISIMTDTKEELTNTDTTQYSLRIYSKKEGFYKYNRLIYKNDLINFEIIPNGKRIRELYGLSLASPRTLFIDKGFVVRNVNDAYFIYDNYEKLKKKLQAVMSGESYKRPKSNFIEVTPKNK